ncbi:MAG: alkaline phosphatase family protein, partial [Gemmatimonadetes bacterium]|nr:alkaline phosphatase family protein [Gemmatimonadota bacterium]
MKKLTPPIRLAVLASLLFSACGETPGGGAARGTPKVLLIGIDGVRPDVLAEVPTPNIDALVQEGWYTAQARTTTPSVSGPSWSSMLTGVWPAKHGVTNNNFTGRDYATYPSFLTRVEAARPELATFAALDWVPLAELPDDPGPVLPAAIDVREVVDGYDLGWGEADGEIAARAARHLSEADPDAMFVYFGNPDETSHRHGSIGAEYRDAIALADSHIGLVVEAMRTRPTYADEDWLVLMSTDHGRRADGGHGGDSPEEMTIFVLASGPATEGWPPPGPAFIVDVAATALAHLGIEIDPDWGLDGVPLGGSPEDRNQAMLDRIRDEGLNRSQLPNTLSYMTDVIGARLTNSVAMDRAQEWALGEMQRIGLENPHREPFMNYGASWDNEYASVHMMEPDYQPLVAYPIAHTPGTGGRRTLDVVIADVRTRGDLEPLRGRLGGLAVLSTPPPVLNLQRFARGPPPRTPAGKRPAPERGHPAPPPPT